MSRAMFRLAFLAGCVPVASAAQAGLVLTAASEFSTNSAGVVQSPNFWNTQPGDPWYNLYFTNPNTGISGGFLNSGDGSLAAISYSLTPGSYQFFMFADPGLQSSYEALNLFFDGVSKPSISAFAPLSYSSTSPAFAANGNASTGGLDGSTTVPGSGTLSATLDGLNVTIADYSWADPSVYHLDRVGRFGLGGNGSDDFVGTFTLVVTSASVPEPSAILLTGVGFAAVAVTRLARRGRSCSKS